MADATPNKSAPAIFDNGSLQPGLMAETAVNCI